MRHSLSNRMQTYINIRNTNPKINIKIRTITPKFNNLMNRGTALPNQVLKCKLCFLSGC